MQKREQHIWKVKADETIHHLNEYEINVKKKWKILMD